MEERELDPEDAMLDLSDPPERGIPERTGVQAASDDRRVVSPIRRRERFGPPGVTVGGSALQR
jgi:hypothetical protein